MGCSGSKAAQPAVTGQLVVQPDPVPVEGQMLSDPKPVAPAAGKGKGKGASKGASKGKGKGKGKGLVSKWQIWLSGNWKDYGREEDALMKRAYMTGQKKCKFSLRGQYYEYDFRRMVQINKETRKERKIRVPKGGPKPPAKPIMPTGPMTVITVKPGQAGKVVHIPDPYNKGQTVPVYVPPHAKPAAKLAVPLPAKGESVEQVQAKQEKHDKENGSKTSKASWSTGAKFATGGAALGAVAVGGVILGDHLAGGEMATTIGAGVVEAGEAIADGAEDAVDAIGDWAPGAGEAVVDAAEDVGDWVGGAAEDIADWVPDAIDDAGEWLGDAAEDTGDFFMDLF